MKGLKLNLFKRFFRFLYLKLMKINDSPHRIALGLGLGVMTGILPGAGPIAALFLAFCFKVNRASALIGSLLTNTWLSLVTFILAVKLGSGIMKVNWQGMRQDWIIFWKDFHGINLLKLSFLKIFLPLIIGYLVVAFCLGFLFYLIAFAILNKIIKKERHAYF